MSAGYIGLLMILTIILEKICYLTINYQDIFSQCMKIIFLS